MIRGTSSLSLCLARQKCIQCYFVQNKFAAQKGSPLARMIIGDLLEKWKFSHKKVTIRSQVEIFHFSNSQKIQILDLFSLGQTGWQWGLSFGPETKVVYIFYLCSKICKQIMSLDQMRDPNENLLISISTLFKYNNTVVHLSFC